MADNIRLTTERSRREMEGTRLELIMDEDIGVCRTLFGAGSLRLETVGVADAGPNAGGSCAVGGIGPAVALAVARKGRRS